MRDMTNHRPCFQRAEKKDSFDKTLVRIILQSMNSENRESFIRVLTDNYAPDIQVKLYAFVKAMICSWAGDPNLTCEDAAVIEDCRKICDVMGWPPEMN